MRCVVYPPRQEYRPQCVKARATVNLEFTGTSSGETDSSRRLPIEYNMDRGYSWYE